MAQPRGDPDEGLLRDVLGGRAIMGQQEREPGRIGDMADVQVLQAPRARVDSPRDPLAPLHRRRPFAHHTMKTREEPCSSRDRDMFLARDAVVRVAIAKILGKSCQAFGRAC